MLEKLRSRYEKLTRMQKITLAVVAIFAIIFFRQYFQWQRFTFESHSRWNEIEKHLSAQNEILSHYAQRTYSLSSKEPDKPQKLLDDLDILKTKTRRVERIAKQQEIQESYSYIKTRITIDPTLSKDLTLAQMGLEIEKIQNRLLVEANRFNELEERKEFLQKQFPLVIAGLFFSKAEKFNFQTE
jgi:cell division protein FtsL